MHPSAYRLRKEPVDIAGSSLPAPVISFIEEEHRWRLEQEYTYDRSGQRIIVPAGFKFDLASVPRPFWFLVAPFDLSVAAPLVHDFLYRYRGDPPPGSTAPPMVFRRREADGIFKEIMEKEGVAAWRRFLAYLAVRWFGGFAWVF